MIVTQQAPNRFRREWDRSANQEVIVSMMKDMPVQGTPLGIGICPQTWDAVLMWKN